MGDCSSKSIGNEKCIEFLINRNDRYKPEKILNDHGKSVNKKQLKKIFSQMEQCICKINCDDGSNASGFLCKNPFPDSKSYENPLKVLITNHRVLNENSILPGKKIELSINDAMISLNIY